ncbi:hypothetical protein SPRG_04067 [Saprolegnia parasitica CBS 223.65]|uniref:Uncharacterized protein n=1 Tax=Saprolegnia parasitica (strain CBS 223.65) TaxID=695850 RepID=A0A067CXC0_SAPPC|nr:hypothetical protein SPRG_04067 [Saprolegnia parasitica CBS 223.65]KDO31452.1 hypothetical protein SPRG_04067 [Saprolegnia parasitica CBS 223.65]|eukprot:XP_012198047.1 hypothetical protein SPRG_04067 [Saprolegnia parasitica CBS 223.65]
MGAACFRGGSSTRSLLFVGLDGAGKSCLLSWLEPTSSTTIVIAPTIGARRCQFARARIRFHAWDLSGHGRYRSLWPYYAGHVHAIVFVVDATDKERLPVVRRELWALLNHKDHATPLLVFLNKSEDPNAVSTKEVERRLHLHQLKCCWRVEACSAVTGAGVAAGVDWLATTLLDAEADNCAHEY